MLLSWLVISTLALAGDAPPSAAAAALEPMAVVAPPGPPAGFDPLRLYVKFRDDAMIRLAADGRSLTDRGSGALAQAWPALEKLGVEWSRLHEIGEDKLTELRETASKNLGRRTPDLNTEFCVQLADPRDLDRVRAALEKIDIVEHVGLVPRPVAPPTAPDFTANQGYLREAASGHGSTVLWAWPGGRGQSLRVCDLEYSWNLDHVDLPVITVIGPPGTDPFNNDNHGTASIGVLAAMDDGVGMTGMCHGAAGYVVPTFRNNIWNVGSAITIALTTLQSGDILLLEQQVQGPNWPGGSSQVGLVPCDWILAWYNAVVTATGNGVTVIAAAANGSQNLDDPVYSTGNGGHWPFLPANDSGAIIVGAGQPPAALANDRVRTGTSNYGSRVNLQSWSAQVASLGYGQLYNAKGPDAFYTASFSGTSSAAAIVAGAAAQLQSLHMAVRGGPLTPLQLREALQSTGSPQQGTATLPVSQNIGPRPNLVGAAFHTLGAIDCDNNGTPDEIDIAMAAALDADDSGGLDVCERPCGRRISVLSNAPALIPDNDPEGVSRTLTVPDNQGVLIGAVVWVELSHHFAGDLIVTLSHGATTVPLVVRVGRTGSGDGDSSDFQGRYVFADQAAGDLWPAAAAAGAAEAIAPATYRPTGPWAGSAPLAASLDSFIGNDPAGTWSLSVVDSKANDRGTQIRWGLVLTTRSPECCLADFNGDGTPGVPDIFAFLAAWFAGDVSADIDVDGTVAVPDVFAFLSAWFAGCP